MAASRAVYLRWSGLLRTRLALLKRARAQQAYRRRKLEWYRTRSKRADRRELAAKWAKLAGEADALVARREEQVSVARRVVKRHKVEPLRLRAYKVAEGLIGTMELGGNNRGEKVMAIIKANGGTGPEPWCGDFQAWCYRLAGSKAVNRSWASVYLLGRLAGVTKVANPLRGDLVRFNFSHVGMFDSWIDRKAGRFLTIEGNTGATGAVSDSLTGGDGVYRKERQTSLVTDYRRVTR